VNRVGSEKFVCTIGRMHSVQSGDWFNLP